MPSTCLEREYVIFTEVYRHGIDLGAIVRSDQQRYCLGFIVVWIVRAASDLGSR